MVILPRRDLSPLGAEAADVLRIVAERLRTSGIVGRAATSAAAQALDDYANALDALDAAQPEATHAAPTSGACAVSELPPCPYPDCEHDGGHYHGDGRMNAAAEAHPCDCVEATMPNHDARRGWSECYRPAEAEFGGLLAFGASAATTERKRKGCDMTRLLYPDAEAREILGGIGRTTLYGLTKEGKITPVKIGRRTFYDHDDLQRYVASLRAETTDTEATDAETVEAAEAHRHYLTCRCGYVTFGARP